LAKKHKTTQKEDQKQPKKIGRGLMAPTMTP
jgi:hypothetical protein